MELLISVVALAVAVYALIVARGMRSRVKKLDGESLYRSAQIREAEGRLQERIRAMGKFVSAASRGRSLSEEQVLEDRLFDEVDAAGAADLFGVDGVVVVDVREAHEYASGHIPGALLVPASEMEARWEEIPPDRTVLVHCASGSRSTQACRFLSQEKGYTRLINLKGGLSAWQGALERGMAVTSSRRRQPETGDAPEGGSGPDAGPPDPS